MSNKEQLSALMDGEAIDLALIKEIEQDEASQAAWLNYHLISDTLRGEAPKSADWDIASRVAVALESEPAHSQFDAKTANDDSPSIRIPAAAKVAASNVSELKESQPKPETARRHLPAWLSQLTQVGVAACVSLMVIFGVQQYSGADGETANPDADQIPVLQTIPFSGSAEPVSLTRDSVRAQSEEAKQMEESRRLNALMQDYEMQLRLNRE
ncbi:MAG: RseA family anti-sigma factor [Vibrio sp.]